MWIKDGGIQKNGSVRRHKTHKKTKVNILSGRLVTLKEKDLRSNLKRFKSQAEEEEQKEKEERRARRMTRTPCVES